MSQLMEYKSSIVSHSDKNRADRGGWEVLVEHGGGAPDLPHMRAKVGGKDLEGGEGR